MAEEASCLCCMCGSCMCPSCAFLDSCQAWLSNLLLLSKGLAVEADFGLDAGTLDNRGSSRGRGRGRRGGSA